PAGVALRAGPRCTQARRLRASFALYLHRLRRRQPPGTGDPATSETWERETFPLLLCVQTALVLMESGPKTCPRGFSGLIGARAMGAADALVTAVVQAVV